MANILSLLKEELSFLKLEASLQAAIMRSCFSASAEDLVNALWSAVAAQNPTDPTATISLEDLKLKLSTALASVTDKPCAFEESSLFDVDSVPPAPEIFDLTLEELCRVGKYRQLSLAHCTPDDGWAREDECNAESENTAQDAESNTEFEKAEQDNTEVEKSKQGAATAVPRCN